MAITFPLPLASFADKLFIASVEWTLSTNQEFSGLGSGQIIAADLGPALWQATVTTVDMYHSEAVRIEAAINSLNGSTGSFYLYDPRRKAPAADPTGAILGASAVQINSLPAGNKSMTLKGLPAGYKLTPGDPLAFDYAGRRAFHEVSEAATANGSGVTPAFEVRPFLRPGVAVNAGVNLVKAAAECRMRPGTLRVQGTGQGTTVISFQVVQRA